MLRSGDPFGSPPPRPAAAPAQDVGATLVAGFCRRAHAARAREPPSWRLRQPRGRTPARMRAAAQQTRAAWAPTARRSCRFERPSTPKGAFVGHVVRCLLQEWRARLAARDPELLAATLFRGAGDVDKAEVALKPLLQLLQRVDTRLRREKLNGMSSKPKVLTEREDWECPHCKYQNRGERIDCRKCKKPDETYEEPDEFPRFEQLLLDKVERVAALVAARDYPAASETYLEMTIGSARWRTELFGLTGDHGAPTRKARTAQGHMRRQAAEMSPMDTEEGRLYLLWLKRLLTLAQILRPSDDPSRNVVH
mmetsp:Transcript_50471/g.156149  ORF Transcript_50471/g.156149 Transcript_50471/m.156149 type:complete len:309 (+) Transcript_50471:260-1186(+)